MGDGTILLLTTTGRKSGKADGAGFTFSMTTGIRSHGLQRRATANPAWLESESKTHELRQFGRKKKSRAEIAPTELRDRLWTRLTTNFKGFLATRRRPRELFRWSHSVRFPDCGLRRTTMKKSPRAL